MAAIEQIIQIAVNERTANQGVTNAATAQTTATNAATAASNAATTASNAATAASTATTTANNAQMTADAALPIANITTGGHNYVTLDASAKTLTFSAPSVNLTDVNTFTTPALRNSANTIVWHEGDVAIVTSSGTVEGTTFAPTSGAYTIGSFQGTNGFRVFNAYNTTADDFNTDLDFGIGDIIQLRTQNNQIVGSTTGPDQFLVTNLQRVDGTAHVDVTLDTNLTPAGGVTPLPDTGATILVTSAETVVSGTYVYTGQDQTTAAATAISDWTLLPTPGGTANLSNLATFTLDTNDPTQLNTVVYDSSNETLSVNGTSISVGGSSGGSVERNFYRYSGTMLEITGLPSEQADGTPIDIATQQAQTIPVAIGTANWTSSYGPTAVPTTNWPQNASVFAQGSKLLYGASPDGDWVFTDTTTGGTTTARTGFTITISAAQRRDLGGQYNGATFMANTQPLRLEVETLVIPTS